jgi:hypothetical protein
MIPLVIGIMAARALPAQTVVAARPDVAARRDSADSMARFGQLMAALNTSDVHTKRFLGITGLRPAQLTFVDVRTLIRGDMASALNDAVARRSRDITAMRNALQASMLLRDELVARDITMSEVVAVAVSPDATKATVYHRPPDGSGR